MMKTITDQHEHEKPLGATPRRSMDAGQAVPASIASHVETLKKMLEELPFYQGEEKALEAAIVALSASECEWVYQREDGVWKSHCGMWWNFDDSEPPASHDVHFCGKCGKRLVVKAKAENRS